MAPRAVRLDGGGSKELGDQTPRKAPEFLCTGCGISFNLTGLKEHLNCSFINPFDADFDARCPVRRQRQKEKKKDARATAGLQGVAVAWDETAGREVARPRRTQRQQQAADGCVADTLRPESRTIRQKRGPEDPPEAFAKEFPVGCEVTIPEGLTARVCTHFRGRVGVRLSDGTREAYPAGAVRRHYGKLRRTARTEAVRCDGEAFADTLRHGQPMRLDRECGEEEEEAGTSNAARVFPVGREVICPDGQRGHVTGHSRGRVGVALPGGDHVGMCPGDLRLARGVLRGTARQQAARDGCIVDSLRCPRQLPSTPSSPPAAAAAAPGGRAWLPLTAKNLDRAAALQSTMALRPLSWSEQVLAEGKRLASERKSSAVAKHGSRRSYTPPPSSILPSPKHAEPKKPPKFHTISQQVKHRDKLEKQIHAEKILKERQAADKRADAKREFLARQDNARREQLREQQQRRCRQPERGQQQRQRFHQPPPSPGAMSQSLGGFEFRDPSPRAGPQGPPLRAAQLRRLSQQT